MIAVNEFYNILVKNEVDFFAGVPDSLLKDFCAYITDNVQNEKNIICANEGGAIALGAGYHLATNKVPLIYMQNSGIGNAVNPLLSLADHQVYSIPIILLIGWRGEPGVKDEPQHIKQGRVTTQMLDSMEIPYSILDENSNFKDIISNTVNLCKINSAPTAILVKKGAFETYKIQQKGFPLYKLTREEALQEVLKYIPENSIIVSTTGMLSRELFEMREKLGQSHENDFLTVGSMGHTSQIALGIALAKPEKQVYCFDGDGSAIMHLGSYAIIGSLAPSNLKIIIFNNGAHDSVGGQPTIGHFIDFQKAAESVNIKFFRSVNDTDSIKEAIQKMISGTQTALIDIRIRKGARKDLGRPTSTPIQNKELFKAFIQR